MIKNLRKNKMLTILAFFASIVSIFLCFVNCKGKQHHNYNELAGVNLIFSYPIVQAVDNKTVFYILIDTVVIVYYKSYMLYQLPKARILETDDKVQNDNTYFLCQKDSSYGFLFKTASVNSNKKLTVDSFLKEKTFAGVKLENGPNDTLIEATNNYDGVLLEKYIAKHNGKTYFDSLFFYYSSDFKLIDFSFSKKMDSLKQMKLFKVRLINNEGFSPQYNRVLPKREYFFELNQIMMDSLKNYVQLIENFNNKMK